VRWRFLDWRRAIGIGLAHGWILLGRTVGRRVLGQAWNAVGRASACIEAIHHLPHIVSIRQALAGRYHSSATQSGRACFAIAHQDTQSLPPIQWQAQICAASTTFQKHFTRRRCLLNKARNVRLSPRLPLDAPTRCAASAR
jgi:hypothetical protein